MNRSKLRRQIAWEAARLLYERQESEYYQAKMKAARRISQVWIRPADLPSNVEIRDELMTLTRCHEGAAATAQLRDMRIEALRWMRRLQLFRPRLIGSVLTGHVRQGSDVDLHLFSDSVDAVTLVLDDEGAVYDVERKHVRKDDEDRIFTHVHVRDRFPIELTIYASKLATHVFKSSITGKPMERASLGEFELLLAAEYPELALDDAVEQAEQEVDRFRVYESLLLPLEQVKQNPKYHPEGDTLFHSLQVFELARNERPYDEELLTAALLHDVGKAIDAERHVEAGLEALEGFITPRTSWLIEHHMEGHALLEGTLGARAKRRLEQSEDFEELVILTRCDRAGRKSGAVAPELDEALDYLRELDTTFG